MTKPEPKNFKPVYPAPRDPKPQPSRADWRRILGRELIELSRRKDLFR